MISSVKPLSEAVLSGTFACLNHGQETYLMTAPDFEQQPGQYGEPGAYPPPPGGQEPGGLAIRFGARLIDGILVHIVGWY